ncbi:hypothetical protein HUG15_20415 [Salicibibacter cibarius]|uniref:Uncharacterized protein n=1 Tax=Salicibibacter cibarius TaxID=2743000 RepID=A0A7T6Z6S1_9BACI|nr:hypothetical protein [Salicibibacter cibarius]QQK77712.1 hypothetical protein HUG15_20415 [Salicibibacter cibarius]
MDDTEDNEVEKHNMGRDKRSFPSRLDIHGTRSKRNHSWLTSETEVKEERQKPTQNEDMNPKTIQILFCLFIMIIGGTLLLAIYV